jgi:hypothetical protein
MRRMILVLVGALFGGMSCIGLVAQQPVAGVVPAKSKFHIYLLMGQSNMVGRDVRSLNSQVDNPRLLALSNDDKWVVARDPIHTVGTIPGGQGPGIPFGL